MREWREFVMPYLLMFFKPPVFILLIYLVKLSERWASLTWQGLFDNTNSCTEYTYTELGELLTNKLKKKQKNPTHFGLNPGSYLVRLQLIVNSIEIHSLGVNAVIRFFFFLSLDISNSPCQIVNTLKSTLTFSRSERISVPLFGASQMFLTVNIKHLSYFCCWKRHCAWFLSKRIIPLLSISTVMKQKQKKRRRKHKCVQYLEHVQLH